MLIKKVTVLISFLVLLSYVSGEETKVSLTFVIDNTESMTEDIEEVKKRTDDVFNAVLNSNASQVDEFILVTFNDPDTKTSFKVEATTLRVKTKSREAFKRALHKIKVYGGDDCQEMSMSGIELGLEMSKPHSFLYVFTDASAKDYKKHAYVQSLAQRKSIQVTFLLTGQCQYDTVEEQHTVYDNIAAATLGQVFHIKKQEISKIIEYILVNIANKRTVLLRKTFNNAAKCRKKYKFSVDSKLWDILIAVSAPRPLHHNEFEIDEVYKFQNLILSNNTSIIKFDGVVGDYSIRMNYCDGVTVAITASTSVTFRHGFSSDNKILSLDETSAKPVQGQNSYLAIALDNGERDVNLKTVELWTEDDDFIDKLDLNLVDADQQLYVTEEFAAPHFTFKIAVKGFTKSKELITRVSSTTIDYEKVKPKNKPASVHIIGAKRVFVEYDKPLELKCKVYGYPQPQVTWEDEYNNVMTSLINNIALDEYISTLYINNVIKNTTFTCKAANFVTKTDFVTVLTKKQFIVLEYPKDVGVEYGKSVELNFKINAIPPATIVWYQNHKEIKNNEVIDILTSFDKSVLKIKNAKPALQGKYSVKATNGEKNVEYTFKIVVTGTESPRIDKRIRTYTKNKGLSVDLLCRIIEGKPEPVISWFFDRKSRGKYRILKGMGQTVHIDHVKSENGGTYKCKAVNEIGTDTHTMQLQVEYMPTVDVKPKRKYEIRTGTKVKLWCLAGGSPILKVRWFVGKKEIKNNGKYKIFRDNTLSFTGVIEDTGSYACEVSNSVGKVRSSVFVSVSEPAEIELPKESTHYVKLRSKLILQCRVKGSPKPKVQWLHYKSEPKSTPEKVNSDENNNVILEEIQPKDEGQYVCIAESNINTVKLTYTVYVPVAASIIPNYVTNIKHVVEGDSLFKLDCIALGSPKPTLKWMFKGNSIEDYELLYEISYEGTLTVYDVGPESNGTYTCKTENIHGKDILEYEVKVHPFPPMEENPIRILLLEGKRYHYMHCGIMIAYDMLVRWYKDGKLISNGELTLINVSKADDGHYTCRVSTPKISFSYHKRAIVGTGPRFLTEGNDTTYITFEEGAEVKLNCSATGDPPPKIKWLRNDKIIKGVTTSQYSFIMTNINMGQNIECSVSNEFSTIKRQFEIIAGECLMKLEDDFTPRQPILATGKRKRQWPIFPTSNGSLRIQKLRQFTLFCPESYITYNNQNYGSDIKTTCVGDSLLELEGKAVLASEITCDKAIIPLANEQNKVQCLGSNTTLLTVGFNVGGSFMTVYRACYDNITKETLFVIHDMHKAVASMMPKYIPKYTIGRFLSLGYEDIYECRNQVDAISSFIGTPLRRDERCCFARRQLVNPKDVLPGISQVATYHYINVVPQWSTCGAENWDEVEDRVRMYAISTNDTITIWTGATSVRRDVAEINLKDRLNQQLLVHQYIWKVVKDQVAVIHVNVPGLTSSTASSYVLCKDICNQTVWMMYDHWHDVDKGFIYCCSIEDFESAFDYEGVFR